MIIVWYWILITSFNMIMMNVHCTERGFYNFAVSFKLLFHVPVFLEKRKVIQKHPQIIWFWSYMFPWTNKAGNKYKNDKREDSRLPNLSKLWNNNFYTTTYRQKKDQKLAKRTQFQNIQKFVQIYIKMHLPKRFCVFSIKIIHKTPCILFGISLFPNFCLIDWNKICRILQYKSMFGYVKFCKCTITCTI